MKRIIAFAIMVMICILPLTGCKKKKDDDTSVAPYMETLTLGTDYTDLDTEIRFLTFRTDIMDKLNAMAAEFNKTYPNITITYEGVNNYEESVIMKLSSGSNWGDIMMIPHIESDVIDDHFMPLGTLSELSKNYRFTQTWEQDGLVYGIPSTGNAYGIMYNKQVFADAGISVLPKTPTEFIAALTAIKQNTTAIPLYTNYADEWPMSSWDAHIGVVATGNTNYINNVMIHENNPFSNRNNETGPYAVYKILYDAVAQGLIEDDYTTTSEAASYGMLNNGEIGCLVLGSWACVQAMGAGNNPNDVGYMPFPISINGQQYISIGPDYSYGINKYTSYEKKVASSLYIKWLTEKSGYAVSEGGIPIYKSETLPDMYSDIANLPMLEESVATSENKGIFEKLNFETELAFNANGNSKVQEIVECAFNGSKTFDQIMNSWNTKWRNAQNKYGVSVN